MVGFLGLWFRVQGLVFCSYEFLRRRVKCCFAQELEHVRVRVLGCGVSIGLPDSSKCFGVRQGCSKYRLSEGSLRAGLHLCFGEPLLSSFRHHVGYIVFHIAESTAWHITHCFMQASQAMAANLHTPVIITGAGFVARGQRPEQ